MSNPYTLVARTRRSLMALAVAALLLVVAAFSAHAQTSAAAKIAFDRAATSSASPSAAKPEST